MYTPRFARLLRMAVFTASLVALIGVALLWWHARSNSGDLFLHLPQWDVLVTWSPQGAFLAAVGGETRAWIWNGDARRSPDASVTFASGSVSWTGEGAWKDPSWLRFWRLWYPRLHVYAVGFPLALLGIPALPGLLWPLASRLRRRRRSRAAACSGCGYDLRGTPQRCPECGTPTRGGQAWTAPCGQIN